MVLLSQVGQRCDHVGLDAHGQGRIDHGREEWRVVCRYVPGHCPAFDGGPVGFGVRAA